MEKLKNLWNNKTARICICAGTTVILTCILLMLLYLTGGFWKKLWVLFVTVLRPIVIGGILCYLLAPLVNRMENLLAGGRAVENRKGWARPAAVFFTLLIVLIVIGLLLLLISFTMYQNVSSVNMETVTGFMAEAQNDLTAFIESLAQRLEELGISSDRLAGIISSAANGVKNAASGLLFGVIFAVYFLLDKTRIAAYWKRALRLLAGNRAAEKLDSLSADADRVFSGYIRGQFIDAIVVGVLGSMALLIAGVPDALVVGILTGLGNLIPYVGPVLGFLTLILVCIPTAAWGKLVAGAVILIVIILVDGNLINPRLLSSSIKIHPLLVVAAVIGGGALGGLVGMIVAVPAAALIKIQLDRYLDRKEAALAVQE